MASVVVSPCARIMSEGQLGASSGAVRQWFESVGWWWYRPAWDFGEQPVAPARVEAAPAMDEMDFYHQVPHHSQPHQPPLPSQPPSHTTLAHQPPLQPKCSPQHASSPAVCVQPEVRSAEQVWQLKSRSGLLPKATSSRAQEWQAERLQRRGSGGATGCRWT